MSAEHAVALVFNGIKSAAMLIEAVNPEAVLESWHRQEAVMPFIDPTSYQKHLLAREDMRRKKEIIEAAAAFLREWNRIKAGALEAAALSSHNREERT